ncbi:MAG: hypothetical protein ACR2NZ_03195, partial [Rubripirellula sp.]
MNRLTTLLIAGFTLTALPTASAGNFGCFFKSRSCGPQVTATHCSTTTDASCCGSTDGAFEPSDLNIQLTGQIVDLRKELEELKLALAEKDQKLSETETLANTQQKEASMQLEKFAAVTKRAKQAEQAMIAAKEESVAQAKKSAEAMASMKENLAKARQSNKRMRAQLDKSKESLSKSATQLAEVKKQLAKANADEKKSNQKKRRQEKNAVET